MRRTGTGKLEVRDFLWMRLHDLWLPVHKSSTSVRQRSARSWHHARTATGYTQKEGNLNQLPNPLLAYGSVGWVAQAEKIIIFNENSLGLRFSS